jgi:6-phosphogluconolactonase
VELFWIDERAVPPDHPDSNYALAAKLLLRPAGIVPSRVHRMRGEVEDLDDAARRASDDFTAIAGNPPQIDLALVGVGEDGHVASVFPSLSHAHADSSAEAQSAKAEALPRPIIAVYDAPKPPPRRLTMTLPVMASAARVVVAAFGTEKARIVNHAVRHAEDRSPVAELLRRAPSSMVLLDGDSH